MPLIPSKTPKKGSIFKTSARLKEHSPEAATISLEGLPGKSIVLGVPGAFTPPCSEELHSFIARKDEFAQAGVSAIYVVTVGDVYVVSAWKKALFAAFGQASSASSPQLGSTGSTGVAGEAAPLQFHFLADDTAKFSSEIGFAFDAEKLLGGKRSKRYALFLEDGLVREVFVENDPNVVAVTTAQNVLTAVVQSAVPQQTYHTGLETTK